MTAWLLPTVALIPAAGEIRTVGKFDQRAYHRAYYHAKRKERRRQTYTPEQKARRYAQNRQRYYANLERSRANGRANYWRSVARKARANE